MAAKEDTLPLEGKTHIAVDHFKLQTIGEIISICLVCWQ
jgi:hypothetical protein